MTDTEQAFDRLDSAIREYVALDYEDEGYEPGLVTAAIVIVEVANGDGSRSTSTIRVPRGTSWATCVGLATIAQDRLRASDPKR